VRWDEHSQNWEGIADGDVKRWSDAYPACDIRGELAKARAWYTANPTKRKRNVYRFLTNWLSRSQERGGSTRGGRPSASTFVDEIPMR